MHDVLSQTAAKVSLGLQGAAAPPPVWLVDTKHSTVFPTAAVFPSSSAVGQFLVEIFSFTLYVLVLVPTWYARIFPVEPEGSGSQCTWISEADTARARTLDGASDGSRHDNNRALARVASP